MKSLSKILFAVLLGIPALSFSQVPVMSSFPAAAPVIFLDFDGHLVQGTSWNWNGPLACAPADLTPEKITEIFHRVAEDYRPFNVNVTTDSTRYHAAPANRRMRIILTVTSQWYGNAGGVAYMGSFLWGDNTPAFVFTSLLNNNAKNIAEAASHEAGHTLGLRHQSAYDANCNKTSDYNVGNGNGEIGWAPIMGVGYYRNLTLWNSGPNPFGCSSIQNDLEVITGSGGLTYRADDYGTQFNSATSANFVNNRFTINGVIEKNSDIDVIKFTLPTLGQFNLSATPFNVGSGNVGSNLDLQVELMTSSNTVIRTYNPADLLSVAIDTTLNSGTYWLRMRGRGNAYTSEYASLGSYSLEGVFASGAVLPLHKFELKGQQVNGYHKLQWNIIADENVIKQIVEASWNGRNFEAIANPESAGRSFTHQPSQQGAILYRIRTLFDNGREYFSNVISLKNGADARPNLQSTMVSQSIIVNSPSGFEYQLFDLGGKRYASGKLNPGLNQLNASALLKGMYIIRFTDGDKIYSEKLLKQ
jgi:hypothetical protein